MGCIGELSGRIVDGRANGEVLMLCVGLIWEETGSKLDVERVGMSIIEPV